MNQKIYCKKSMSSIFKMTNLQQFKLYLNEESKCEHVLINFIEQERVFQKILDI